MAVAGRGNRLLTFYLNPTNFPNPSKDWAFLADLIQWARNQAPTLARTEMILGDPYRGEAYGYAHFLGRHGILSLRNPFIQPQAVRLKLDESSGWLAREAGDGRFTASVVFPYHETLRPTLRHGDWLELILQPYQTVIVEIEDKRASSPTLAGVRLREVSRSARKMSWEVYGLPGTKVSVPVTGLPKLTKIQVDGQARGSFGTKPSVDLPISFRGEKKRCFAEGGTIRAEPSVQGPDQLVGKCSATIPPGTKASIYVLYLDPSPAEMEFSCHAIINGKAVPAAEIHKLEGSKNTLRPVRELPLKPWVFFRIPVPEGKNEIKLSLDSVRPGNQAIEVQAGWWLWTEQPLQKATLTMDFNEVLPPAAAKVFPFPAPSEVQRQVFPLQAMKSYSLREGMPRSPP